MSQNRLGQLIHVVGRKFMTVHSIVAKITGEKRGASEGVWVQGGGLEVRCKYFVYGPKKSKPP